MMSKKSKRRITILLIISVPLIYIGIWLYGNIPPRLTPNIDFFIKKHSLDFSDEEMKSMWDAYEKSSFLRKVCFKKYLDARDHELLRYCLENKMAQNIGGGCYHMVGRYNQNDTYHGLKYCGITWTEKTGSAL